MATPEEIAAQVRFALASLAGRNGHHEFEELCRHLARQRLCGNIVPATGPVSAGGDQGRDFETFRTYLRMELGDKGAFLGRAADKTLVFTCTLQEEDLRSKILADVQKVCTQGEPVDEVYVLCAAELPVGHRHRLQETVRERFGVRLEVLDGRAIAEQLADYDLFWIAERYLSLSAELRPSPPPDIAYAEHIKISLAENPAPLTQTPPDVADFTGRREELTNLKRVLTRSTGKRTNAVVISAVAGKPGVGKSALAVHLAHQLVDKFADGQLYANLRGADEQPRTSEAVLEEFLLRFGVVGDEMPQSLDAKAALYRERLAGKRMLVILDNAASERQVRPLLPGGPTCAVIVTSRAPLSTLGAYLLQLDVLDSATAIALLANVVGDKRIQDEAEQAAGLARLCGHLPLAL